MRYSTKYWSLFTVISVIALSLVPRPAQAYFVFNGCTPLQEEVVLDAYSLAFSRIKDAESFVFDNSIYTRWFGDWEKERAGKVLEQIYAMTSAALIGTPEFTCLGGSNEPQLEDVGCSYERLAFFYTREDYHIYLCESFWSIGTEHPDLDQTGVLIHELSHLSFDASTRDHCYAIKNRDACLELAETSPEDAIKSADNFRMFVFDVSKKLGNHQLKDVVGSFVFGAS